MRLAKLGGLNVRLTGGTDGRGGGSGPSVILLHGFGAPGDDLLVLADVLSSAAGTRWIFPEGPLPLNMGLGASRAWWLIDMARLEADRAAGTPGAEEKPAVPSTPAPESAKDKAAPGKSK